MKIIGGKKTMDIGSTLIDEKLLWPCYEVVASASGLDNIYKGNVIEEYILKLAELGITDTIMIADTLFISGDLVDFVQARLYQKCYLDEVYKITDEGLEHLSEKSKQDGDKESRIFIYVDAIGGKLLRYYCPSDYDNSFHYEGGAFDKSKRNVFCYKEIASAGNESNEECEAYCLNKNLEYNKCNLQDDDVIKMLCAFTKKPDVYGRVIGSDDPKLVYVLIDALIMTGDIENWVLTDGFGGLSRVFGVENIINTFDKEYLITKRKSGTSEIYTKNSSSTNCTIPNKYSRLESKIEKIQSLLPQIKQVTPSSSNEVKRLKAQKKDILIAITQLFEWSIFYVLHDNYSNVSVALNELRGSRDFDSLIAQTVLSSARELGFTTEGIEGNFRRSFGAISHSYNDEDSPNLFCLVDLLIESLKGKEFFKKFAFSNKDFLVDVARIKTARDSAFHSGLEDNSDIANTTDIGTIEEFCKSAENMLHSFLGISLDFIHTGKNKNITYTQQVYFDSKYNSAIAKIESDLGYALFKSIDRRVFSALINVESTVSDDDKDITDNSFVIEQYALFEAIFSSVISCIPNSNLSGDWLDRASEARFIITSDVKNIIGKTKDVLVSNVKKRGKGSLGALCIEFFSKCDMEVLIKLQEAYSDLLCDVAYIIKERGHGEIPLEIDGARCIKIKQCVIDLLKILCNEGFLLK